MNHIVYSGQAAPETYSKSIFLVGPTPRSKEVPSWRPAMIEALDQAGYDGVIFYPEHRDGIWQSGYESQVEWEKKHLEMADVIIAWVPRSLQFMPAFTTNVEFGLYVGSGKLLYGRPCCAEKCDYLDWMYQDHTLSSPYSKMFDIALAATERFEDNYPRSGGERDVPYNIWSTTMFQQWYSSQKAQGNRLDAAKVLWTFISRINLPFAYSLWVKIWIEAEQRHKENEFVLARSDISAVLAFWKQPNADILETKIVLVKEFRSPVRNSKGFVLELPGGSSFKEKRADPLKVAAEELKEETGLVISPERFFRVQSRQMASTFSSHHAILFGVQLTEEEIQLAEISAKHCRPWGILEDSEQVYVEVKTLRELMLTDSMDWSMIGMVVKGITDSFLQR